MLKSFFTMRLIFHWLFQMVLKDKISQLKELELQEMKLLDGNIFNGCMLSFLCFQMVHNISLMT